MRHEQDGHPSPLPRHTRSSGRAAAARASLPRSSAELPELGAEFWPTVDAGLRHLGVELSTGARSAIEAQARLLLAWNQAINLTALRTPEQVARGHVLDSLSAWPWLSRLAGPPSPGRSAARAPRLLDLGSGGGYPGLPLAVALPAAACALVDSVAKKAAFLEVAADAARAALEAAGEVPPALTAFAERAEDLAEEPEHREGWDVVVARAVGTLAEVAELALPLLRIGGHLVAWKRNPADGSLSRELVAARRVLQAAGGSRPRVEAPPGMAAIGLSEHVLVTVRKLRPTPDRYPRPASERRRSLR